MRVELLLVVLACLPLAMVLTAALRRRALRVGMLDVPNARSSHVQPTPRGGGLAIVMSIVVGSGALVAMSPGISAMLLAVLPGFIVIAMVGWLDDRRGVAPALRLGVHLASALWCVVAVALLQPGWLANATTATLVISGALLVLAIAWATNLFNFMDGIDGIAASQAAFISIGGAVLCLLDGQEGAASFLAVIAAASIGFLVFNWPPAKIFMGDVGSGALGFLLAAAPVSIATQSYDKLFPWFILWGAFVSDSGVTLVRRALRRERLSVAHRSHAYQRLSRRWASHLPVTLSYMAVNMLWLAPLSFAAWRWPHGGLMFTLAAWCPLLVAAALLGAGKKDL